MARAREIPGLEAGTRFREAAARAVWVRTEEVFSFREGVLDVEEIERVHDMRVATRRLRAVLELFEPCFPKRPHRSALREVKRLADALGERRDPDVQVDALAQIAAGFADEDRPGVESLRAALRADQKGANRALARTLEEIEVGNLEGRLQMLAEMARSA